MGVWPRPLPSRSRGCPGAGGHVVRRCGRVYEALSARREQRAAQDLYHAALMVTLDGRAHGGRAGAGMGLSAADRGVAVQGPVGLRSLGRWRAFRYELRRWPGGVIPPRRGGREPGAGVGR